MQLSCFSFQVLVIAQFVPGSFEDDRGVCGRVPFTVDGVG